MNPWRRLSRLPKPLWIVSTAMLINRAGTMALPFLVLYLTRHMGFSPSDAGLLLTAYGVGALVTGPFAGKLSDRHGPVRIMKASLFLSALILGLFPFLQGHPMLLMATLAWAMVSEAFRPAAMSLVSDVVDPGDRKIAVSVIRLAVNVGMSIGPALGGFILLVSYDLVFWIDGATSLIAGILLLSVSWEQHLKQASASMSPASWREAFHAFKDRRMLSFLLAMTPMYVIFFQYESTLPLYMVHDLRMDEQSYGLLFPINTILIIALEISLNVVMANWPHRKSLLLGGALVVSGFAATGLAWNFPTLAATVVIWTFGEMILMPTSTAFVADISPVNRRGEYMGVYQMCFSLAFALSGWAGTAVYQYGGAGMLWGGVFLTGLVSLGVSSRIRNPDPVLAVVPSGKDNGWGSQ